MLFPHTQTTSSALVAQAILQTAASVLRTGAGVPVLDVLVGKVVPGLAGTRWLWSSRRHGLKV